VAVLADDHFSADEETDLNANEFPMSAPMTIHGFIGDKFTMYFAPVEFLFSFTTLFVKFEPCNLWFSHNK